MPLGKCLIQVVGQTALLEAKLDINLAATADVDVHQQIEYTFRKKFEELYRDLIAEYLGGQPTDLFYQLAKKYKVPLEGFVK